MVPGLERAAEYVLRFATQVAGRIVTSGELGDDLFDAIFKALSREEEIRVQHRDTWGNWDWPYGDAQRRGEQYVPWLDRWISRRLNVQQRALARWPEGRRFAICLTHDVDALSRCHVPVASVVESIRRLFGDGTMRERLISATRAAAKCAMQLPRVRRDPLWHYEDWLRLESDHGFHSTFFVFPPRVSTPHVWDANYRLSDRVGFDGVLMSGGEMFRRIAQQGWEIGLHGSYHSATDARILADERAQIETAMGAEVWSVRQHYLHYEVDATPVVQSTAGFRIDSTQGFNRGIGFRAGSSLPYWCWNWDDGSALPVLEIPQHVMDGALFGAPSLQYSPELALAHVIQLMDEVEAVGGCLTLSWHPEYMNIAAYWDVYRTVLEEGHRRMAWGCSLREAYTWWIERETRLCSVESINPKDRERDSRGEL